MIGLDDVSLRNANGGLQPCTVQEGGATKEGGEGKEGAAKEGSQQKKEEG